MGLSSTQLERRQRPAPVCAVELRCASPPSPRALACACCRHGGRGGICAGEKQVSLSQWCHHLPHVSHASRIPSRVSQGGPHVISGHPEAVTGGWCTRQAAQGGRERATRGRVQGSWAREELGRIGAGWANWGAKAGGGWLKWCDEIRRYGRWPPSAAVAPVRLAAPAQASAPLPLDLRSGQRRRWRSVAKRTRATPAAGGMRGRVALYKQGLHPLETQQAARAGEGGWAGHTGQQQQRWPSSRHALRSAGDEAVHL